MLTMNTTNGRDAALGTLTRGTLTRAVLPALAVAMIAIPQPGAAQGFRGGVRDALGPQFDASPNTATTDRSTSRRQLSMDRLRDWHSIALDATGLDHTPVATGESRVFGEQLGPGRSSRAMAIVHVAIFDAINAIRGGYRGFTDQPRASDGASTSAAIAQAAHDTLVALYPSQRSAFDELLARDMANLRESGKAEGIDVGKRAAAAILALAATDGAQHQEMRVGIDFIPSNEPGKWRPDPVSQIPIALGARWGAVRPFVMQTGSQFRLPPPPALNSRDYASAFNEAKRMGGDGLKTATVRSQAQTDVGIYWAYDGTPSLCAPPRLYNQIIMRVADTRGTSSVVELARLLALANLAMADTGIAAWDSKYHYQFWRPITGVREASRGAGPTGRGDGNSGTQGDPNFMPLGAPASNLQGPNFTPPFPAYPSGHAAFGGALFQTLRNFYGTDRIAFTFVSDEMNGETHDNQGNVRPLVTRRFNSLSEAEEENGHSRVYLGIHWSFDKTEGIAQGRQVANYVFRNALQPLRTTTR